MQWIETFEGYQTKKQEQTLNLLVVLCLKKIEFFFNTIAWVCDGEFKRLSGWLVWCLKRRIYEGNIWRFNRHESLRCHITKIVSFNTENISTQLSCIYILPYGEFDTLWQRGRVALWTEKTRIKFVPNAPESRQGLLKTRTVRSTQPFFSWLTLTVAPAKADSHKNTVTPQNYSVFLFKERFSNCFPNWLSKSSCFD